MTCTIRWRVVLVPLFIASMARAADAKYTIKPASAPAPSELSEPIRKLLDENSIKLLGENGAAICELWFCKELPAKATPAQIKNGLTYREVEESTVIGAVRFEQMIGAGV